MPFRYVEDQSPIGQATPFHGDYIVGGACGLWVACPGSWSSYEVVLNNSQIPEEANWNQSTASITETSYTVRWNDSRLWLSRSVASNITEPFISATGAENLTVASVFDIQYRNYINLGNTTPPAYSEQRPWYDRGRQRTVGRSQFYQSLLLNNRYDVVEGLVVVTITGGVGVRNHTLPPTSTHPTTWAEDLLWLNPETTCVALNISLELRNASFSQKRM